MIENLPNEQWLPIKGFERLYEISSYGRVKSTKFPLHRILSPNAKVSNHTRYLKVKLMAGDGTEKIERNHRLVAFHFLPNPLGLTEVNHKDGNRDNNHFSNLEWINHQGNTLHGGLTTRPGKTSRFKGVSRNNIGIGGKTFRWAVYLNGQHHRRFGFKTEEEAFEDLKQYYRDNGIDPTYLER